jgi:hypothetical protein
MNSAITVIKMQSRIIEHARALIDHDTHPIWDSLAKDTLELSKAFRGPVCAYDDTKVFGEES